MSNQSFPFSYFLTIFKPKAAFLGRKHLSWWQQAFVFVFLCGVMLIPVSLNSDKILPMSLEETMPTLWQTLKTPIALPSNLLTFDELHLKTQETQNVSDEVGIQLSEEQFLKMENGINLVEEGIQLKDSNKRETFIYYTQPVINALGEKDFRQTLDASWVSQNKSNMMISTVLLSGFLIVVNLLLILLGSSLIVWLTKKSQFSTIKNFKEATNLILNCVGLSTLVALIFGLIHYDVTLMLSFQSFGMVLMLVGVFYQTRFNDTFANK